MSNSSSIPGIRSFQMDGSSVGILKNSVNLFRGDVNYSQTLFSMPGRNSNDGLGINIVIQYQSNINQQAMTWNRSGPTGILGMGWTMPFPVITLDTSNSPTAGQQTYSLNNSQLIPEPVNPFLFSMDSSLASQLINGQAIPAAIRSQFVSLGLPVSTTAIINGNTSPWTVQDDALEQEFLLVLENGNLNACDGGQSYQLVSYNFWKILYYPRYQCWRVINSTGQVSVYGGGVVTESTGYNSSCGNGIQWAVQWTDASGNALWQGDSSVAAGQQQYATAWNLTRIYSSFGEYISYAYNEFTRGSDGLLPDVEQLVATGGLPFTKACYLTGITDVFGRTVTFNYQPKLWSNASSTSPQEYSDPHKSCPLPDNTPNGFQDCYQSFYLDNIIVNNTDSTVLFSLQFYYNPSPEAAGAEAVVNVAGSSGDTCKRLLTGFTLSNSAGQTLPGFGIDYYVNSTDINPGALQTITWPTGGTATYTYQAAQLAICTRDLTMTPPAPMPATASPRVWFGSGYAVVMWYNTGSEQLSLQIVTWNGQWNSWQLDPSSALLLSGNGGTALETVNVVTGENFVAVYYNTGINGELYTNAHFFRQIPGRPCQWQAVSLIEGNTGGCNSPGYQWNQQQGSISIMAGDNFLLATQTNMSGLAISYDVMTWQWFSQSWTVTNYTSPGYLWFGTGAEYFVTVDMSSNVTLNYLSATGSWQPPVTLNLGFTLYSYQAIQIAAGASMIAIANLTAGGASNSSFQDYSVYLVQWNSAYQFTAAIAPFQFQDHFNNCHTGWCPVIVNNSLVAIAGHLLRFDGQNWQQNNSLMPVNALPENYQQRYCYGPDYAVMISAENVGGVPTAFLVAYDASVSYNNTWSTVAATTIAGIFAPQYNSSTANFAAGGNDDYLTIGSQLFFRGTATNWATAVAQNIADIETVINQNGGSYELNSESLINQGPDFLAFSAYNMDETSASTVAAIILQNGGVYGSAQFLDGAKMWTQQEIGASGSNGVYPGGSSCFYTYPDTASNLESAGSITLYYYAGCAIEGAISDWPVATISINDGLSESSVTSYVPDTTTACCDASGTVIKYYQNTVYPAGNASAPAYGSVVCNYLNGNQQLSGDNYYDMMDGMLSSVSCFDADGNLLTTQANTWIAFTLRAGDPVNNTIPPKQLYGAYVLQQSQITVRDGVTSSQISNYVPANLDYPYTGSPATVTSTDLNGSGNAETIIQSCTYACEAYSASNILNNITSQIAQATTINAVTTNAGATTYTGWASVWGQDVLVLSEDADFIWTGGDSNFPFSSYQTSQPPAGWQCSTRITDYMTNGSVITSTNGAGTVQIYNYATSLGLPVASLTGAFGSECACNSFQTYEDQSSWTATGTSVCTGNAWFGIQSLCLGNGGNLTTGVEPKAGRSQYLLGFRYLTPDDYQDNSCFWTITIGSTQQTVAFKQTNGLWQYQTSCITLPANTTAITITASNTGNAVVFLDSVIFVPFNTGVTLLSWMPQTRLMRSSMTASGAVSFILYDNYWRTLGAVAANGQLQELTVSFMSLQGVSNGVFNNASPNAGLTLQMGEGGIAETFVDGGGWQSRWLTGDNSLWTATFNDLGKTSNTPDTLTWQGTCTATTKCIAFFMEFTLPTAVSDSISIQFASSQTIAWIPNQGWSWTDASGSSQQTPLATPPQIATQWLLILNAEKLLFFANGQLIFSQAASISTLADFSFNTGTNALSINNLITGFNPRTGVVYGDGAARQRQFLQLHDTDSLMQETIYDGLDNPVAQTRIAPGSFGQGAAVPTLQYRDTFVDVPAFLASLDNTWLMTGDIASYYAGQQQGVYDRSNDQGYPYSGQRFESSAQQRLLESGLPGLELAIHDVNTIPFATRQTSRMVFSANPEGTPIAAVAANQYNVQTSYSPGGMEGQLFINTNNAAIATQLVNATNNSVISQTQTSPDYTENTDNTDTVAAMSLKLPNAFTNSPQGNPEAFVRIISQNPLGQVSAITDPDTGNTQYLYNGANQVRFVQVPLESGENYFLYTCYDVLGRISEEGIVNASWNEDRLLAQVNNPGYPASSDGAVIARVYSYDGNGNNPDELGNLVQVTTYNPAPASAPTLGDCTIVEQWSYDEIGRAISASIAVSGAVTQTATANYSYNNLNQITRIDFPDAPSLSSIVYSYNDQGKPIAIGTPEDPNAIISYIWSADGQIIATRRGVLTDAWAYDSASSITAHSVDIAGQTVFSQNYTYNPDRQITSRNTAIAFRGATGNSSINYSYDNQQRLTSAAVASGGAGNLNIDQYDANGNIWSWQQDMNPCSACCNAGTNQLDTVTLNGQTASFNYRQDGRPDQWRGMQIEYNPALSTTAAVTSGDVTVRYARGLNNYRVLRQSGSDTRISFQGAGHVPLIIWNNGQPQLCVWGINGLEAVYDDGELHYPVTDHHGTVYAVTDTSGNLLASYEYGAFGNILSQSGAEASSWLFQYTGTQWDSTIGLYDFNARFYDPVLMRFLAPDAAMQYASLYLFASNNPVNMVDPGGNKAKWVSWLISAVLIVAGVAVSIVTDGAAGEKTVEDGVRDAIADAGEDAAGDLADGEGGTKAKSSTASVIGKSVARGAGCGAMIGAGTHGLKYDITSGSSFTWAGYGKAAGTGALSGAVSGALGGVSQNGGLFGGINSVVNDGTTFATKLAKSVLYNTIGDVAGNVCSTLLTDACNQQPVTWQQMTCTMAGGCISGVIGGVFGATPACQDGSVTKALFVCGTVIGQSFAQNGVSNYSSNHPSQSNSPASSPVTAAVNLSSGTYILSTYQNWGKVVSQGSGSGSNSAS
jgi:RHS repeat-associated protein